MLTKVDGKELERAGPIVLGRRLRTAKLPQAHRVIVYEKGAWVMHMLRGIIGDESFFEMLRMLCERFAGEPVTTEGFRALVSEFMPDGHRDPDLTDFFDQWVYGTGIPRLRVRWDQVSRNGRHHFKMRVSLSEVPEYFPLQVPVEVRTLPDRSVLKVVNLGDGEEAEPVSIVLRNPASSVDVDPQGWLLAEVQR